MNSSEIYINSLFMRRYCETDLLAIVLI